MLNGIVLEVTICIISIISDMKFWCISTLVSKFSKLKMLHLYPQLLPTAKIALTKIIGSSWPLKKYFTCWIMWNSSVINFSLYLLTMRQNLRIIFLLHTNFWKFFMLKPLNWVQTYKNDWCVPSWSQCQRFLSGECG